MVHYIKVVWFNKNDAEFELYMYVLNLLASNVLKKKQILWTIITFDI